ncbi:hypothetical protein [Chengkuizengella sediminis]|uniref:hypothetical protein n=1 Tax=Chengkuizengella sediminis TaxID=1885917 RepID=UPI00138A4561|nr:hypothetical protein [Chengkuizengella sediminis]NDI35401.1 hypothetical protein [Chengkuizengella sediminis]
MIDINLLPKKDRERNLVPIFIICTIICWFLLTFLLIYQDLKTQDKLSQESRNVEDVLSEQNQLETVLSELNEMKLDKEKINIDDIVEVLHYIRMDTAEFITTITTRLPKDGQITGLSFYFPDELYISSEMKSLSDAADYLVDIRNLPFTHRAHLEVISKNGQTKEKSGTEENGKSYLIQYVIEMKKIEVVNADEGTISE